MSIVVDFSKFKFTMNPNNVRTYVVVTPADDTAILINGHYPVGLFVGSAGDLAIYDATGTAKIFKNLSNGEFLIPLNIVGVASTGTTASNILAIGG